LELVTCQHYNGQKHRCPHALVIKLVVNEYAMKAYATSKFNYKTSCNDHETLSKVTKRHSHTKIEKYVKSRRKIPKSSNYILILEVGNFKEP
jgi:hypothetical protein